MGYHRELFAKPTLLSRHNLPLTKMLGGHDIEITGIIMASSNCFMYFSELRGI